MFKTTSYTAEIIQPRLKIGQPDDKYEREADSVADAVMRMPDLRPRMQPMEEEEEKKVHMKPELGSPLQMKPDVSQIQQMCPRCRERARQGKPLDCPECGQKLQMSPAIQKKGDESTRATPQISNQLQTSKGQGPPLPTGVQQEMSHKIGMDFSGVHVHTDAKSHQLNQQLGAKAFTYGSDIYFNKGEYNPGSKSGKRLLAHELTHVVQQGTALRFEHLSLNENGEDQMNSNELQMGMSNYVIQLYPGDGMDLPGDCSWARYFLLRCSVETAKAVVSTLGACSAIDSCLFLAAKIAAITAEIAARVALDTTCFRGGDTGHRQQVQDKINMMNRCYRFFANSNCPPELIGAMEVVVERAREVIAIGAVAGAIAAIVALIVAIIALAEVIAALAAATAEATAIGAAAAAVIALLVLIKDDLAPEDLTDT